MKFRGTKTESRILIAGLSCYGLTTAFSITNWLNFSIVGVILVLIALLITFARRGVSIEGNIPVHLLCIALVFSVGISIIASEAVDPYKMWAHAAARVFSIVSFLLIPSLAMKADSGSIYIFRKGLVVAAIVVLILVLYDSLRLNGIVNFGTIPHLGVDDELDALARGSTYRARGGSIEPGHDASVICAVIPLLGYWIKGKQFVFTVSIIFLVVYLTGFSTALALWYAIFMLVYAFLHGGIAVSMKIYSAGRVAFGFLMLYFIFVAAGIDQDLSDKFISSSYEDRLFSFVDILEGSASNFVALLFGYGPGGYLVLNVERVTNTFSSFFLDLGLLGFLLYLLMVLVVFIQLLRIGNNLYTAAFVAYASSFVLTIGNYWFPTHWLFLLYPYFAIQESVSETRPAEKSVFFGSSQK